MKIQKILHILAVVLIFELLCLAAGYSGVGEAVCKRPVNGGIAQLFNCGGKS